MSADLVLLMWLADIVGSISVVCFFALIALAAATGVAILHAVVNEDPPKWTRLKPYLVAASVFALVGIVTPNPKTIYAAAALKITGAAVETTEFQLMRQLLQKELRKLVEDKTK